MKRLYLIGVIIGCLLLAGCVRTIDEVKTDDYIGKEVTVKGTVTNTLKIGELSGYTLVSENGDIAVASEELPKEGTTKTVRGTIRKGALLGYYLESS